jgi:hypothetical protein
VLVAGLVARAALGAEIMAAGCDSVSTRHVFFVCLRLYCNFKTLAGPLFHPDATRYTDAHPVDAVAQREHSNMLKHNKNSTVSMGKSYRVCEQEIQFSTN